MKSTLLKTITVLVFIGLIGSFVAYRMGAFESKEPVKNVNAAEGSVAPTPDKIDTPPPTPAPEEEIMSSSKSGMIEDEIPFTEEKPKQEPKKQVQKPVQQNQQAPAVNEEKKYNIMPGSKSMPIWNPPVNQSTIDSTK